MKADKLIKQRFEELEQQGMDLLADKEVLSLIKWYRSKSHKVVPVKAAPSIIWRQVDGEKGKASW